MRFVLAILALVASASAQTFPLCAKDCLFGINVDLDGCLIVDNVCLCNSQKFVAKSTMCIESSCSGNDLQTALLIARQLCASVNVTLTSTSFPSTFATSPTSTSASSTASAPTTTSNAATPHRGSTNAFAGLVAIGLAGLAL